MKYLDLILLFLAFIYKNFSFPILLLILVLIFFKPLSNILANITKGELDFTNGGMKMKFDIENSTQKYKEEYEKINDKNLELSYEHMSEKIEKLFGEKFKNGIPIDNLGGGGAPPKEYSQDPYVFKSHLFNIIVSEEGLKKEFKDFGFKETIIAIYTSYLSTYKKDKWVLEEGHRNRNTDLEKEGFEIATYYYSQAIDSEKDWDIDTILAYQKLIRVILVSYEI
ncbi:hypothetical protein ACT9T1_08510 [Staphylococcus xylosus]|uniref:hypothetical protein n=1 Tax=Staphylococcus xylosus TaxID=1288 RepID=UPI00403EC43F